MPTDTTPTTTDSSSDTGYTLEVRFAVVMYGGISLAIYINGVAQELLRMARATAPIDAGEPIADDALESVYRKLSYLAADASPSDFERPPTRFVIDTISGSSAGGINGIFLAKALANGQRLDQLQELWVREGAIERLINDRLSQDKPLPLQNPPASLLNSPRLYFELLKAFDEMDNSREAALVDEVDLFVTTTDLQGVTLPIRLADDVVYERRHRNLFHFIYSKDDEPRNDFSASNNPFLAYAARCTSSFPVAFEPMVLRDNDAVLDLYSKYANKKEARSDSEDWKRFYRSYEDASGLKPLPFPQRAFADGGDLDNKPFSYPIETLASRHADVPVERKLIYIEPSPEHPEQEVELQRKPNVLENVLDAVSTLPRYETIREDLQRVVDRNRLIERINRVINGVEDDEVRARAASNASGNKDRSLNAGGDATNGGMGALDCFKETERQLWTKAELSDEEWATLDLTDMIRRKGRAYIAYHRMEIAALTDDLATLVTRVAGLDENSDYFQVIRGLVRAWREIVYTEHKNAENPRPTMNAFLNAFDLSYPLRRLAFVQRKASQLLLLDDAAKGIVGSRTKLLDERREFSASDASAFKDELRNLKRQLKPQHDSLRTIARRLRSRHVTTGDGVAPSPVYTQIKDLIKAVTTATGRVTNTDFTNQDPVLNYFLGEREPADAGIAAFHSKETVEDRAARRAANLLKDQTLLDAFKNVASTIESEVGLAANAFNAKTGPSNSPSTIESQVRLGVNIDRSCLKILAGPDDPSSARDAARACLRHYYRNYDDYDMITFPLLYDTGIGEPALVEIFRVSPEDAKALIDERKSKCKKLAGTALGHFGAFLEKRWRQNDILWGRLDGAERLITAVLPPGHPQHSQAARLIREAQAAILYETIRDMGHIERQDLLCESLMRTGTGEAEEGLLTEYIERLRCAARCSAVNEHLTPLLDAKQLRQHYLDTYDKASKLEPESTLRTAARATTVIGKMFNALGKEYNTGQKYGALLANVGQVFWGLVEVSVPRSIPYLLARYWIKLLYLFEALMIVGGTILLKPGIQQFGFLAFGLTLAVNLAIFLLNDVMQRRNRALNILKTLVIIVGLLLVATGVTAVAGLLGSVPIWKRMIDLNHWFTHPSFWRKWSPLLLAVILFLVAIRDDLIHIWARYKGWLARERGEAVQS